MLNEPNKDENQEQMGTSTGPAEVPQLIDSHDDISPLPCSTLSAEDQVQQQGTGCDGARVQDAEHRTDPEGAVARDGRDTDPDVQSESDSSLSGLGQADQKPVSADGTDALRDQANPEIDDPFDVSDQAEEEKMEVARVMDSHQPYLLSEAIEEHEEGSDDPAPTPESTMWPEFEEYEPPPTQALIRRAGQIDIVRIEWRGLRPIRTIVNDRYRLRSLPSEISNSIRLPNDVADYHSPREVFDEVYNVLQNCSALSPQQCEVLTIWSIASWFQDSLDYIPRLTVTGPWYAADLLFTLLSYVCRRAIPLVGMSPAVLKKIDIERLRPTLLIRQIEASKAEREILDATDYPGYIFCCAGELHQSCCAKVLYVGEAFNPKQSTSGLHIHLGRNAPIPARPYRTQAAIERLQSKLLSYYAFNHARIHLLEIPAGELQPDFDVIARRLGAVIVSDSRLQRRLVELLKCWSEDVRAERAGGQEGTVLTAALNLAHSHEPQAYVQKVAGGVNQIRTEQGESAKLSNEKVGHVLRKLGLRTHRDMKGSALVFDQSTLRLIHELCFEYGVLPTTPECGYCHELQTRESE